MQLIPEERALKFLNDSEVASSCCMDEVIYLHRLLSTIYAAFNLSEPAIEIDWTEEHLIIYGYRNQRFPLYSSRVKLSELHFVPDGWTVFFMFHDEIEAFDSLSLNVRRRT
ncbi:MAG: hypothetical protein AAFQ63_08985 [Cyanobacteria bacterium J06621_11]